MHLQEQVAAVKDTREFHRKWYCETYPEVDALGMEPIEHYLRYGAALGRNPGKFFDAKWYFETYPDAAASGLNPLVHYALLGKEMGYGKRSPKKSADVRQVAGLRTKLLSLGFTEAPLAELAHLAVVSGDSEARALASRELALWHMRQKAICRRKIIH